MFDTTQLSQWLDKLDPKSRASIVLLAQALAERETWVPDDSDFEDPAQILGTLDDLHYHLINHPESVAALDTSEGGRDAMMETLTYINPMRRIRFIWDLARLPVPSNADRSTLLERMLNDFTKDDHEIEQMRRYLRMSIGLVARIRLSQDFFRGTQLERVKESVNTARAFIEMNRATLTGHA